MWICGGAAETSISRLRQRTVALLPRTFLEPHTTSDCLMIMGPSLLWLDPTAAALNLTSFMLLAECCDISGRYSYVK